MQHFTSSYLTRDLARISCKIVLSFGVLSFLFFQLTGNKTIRSENQFFLAKSIETGRSERFTDGFQSLALPDTGLPHVHAGTLVETPEGLRAFWYSGTREGAKDVAIYSAFMPWSAADWLPPKVVMTRERLQQDLHRSIKKLGNAVPFITQSGELALYFVSVSIGGWAGSALNVMVSADHGETWGAAQRLVTSPFWNISTLVKETPFMWANGDIGLPAYHEFMGKFGEIVRINPAGQVVAKQRLESGRHSIQPSLMIHDPQHADVYLRYAGAEQRRIYKTRTQDGGQTWSEAQAMDLPNPNAAVASVKLSSQEGGQEGLLVYNRDENFRHILSLAWQAEAEAPWLLLCDLESGGQAQRFSYPHMIQDRLGVVHLVYTDDRAVIRHIRFTPEWLAERVQAATPNLDRQTSESKLAPNPVPRCGGGRV